MSCRVTALLLNVCSGRISEHCGVDLGAEGCGSDSVGDLIFDLSTLIMNGDCLQATVCAAAVNEGDALVAVGAAPPEEAPEESADAVEGIARQLALVGDPKTPERSKADARYDLLTALSRTQDLRVRLGIIRGLVDYVYPGLQPLLVEHLEQVIREAKAAGQSEMVSEAGRLLKELGTVTK
jgi:hypothetical protein